MTSLTRAELARLVTENLRVVPDFPTPGVLFRDMSPLLANGEAFSTLIETVAAHYRGRIDAVAGLESRGFLLAAPLAVQLQLPMLLIRKAGKLPGPLISEDYDLEYGSATLQLRPDAVPQGARVLVVDDVLATGGTARASAQLLTRAGATVSEVAVLMELVDLEGRKKLGDIPFTSLLRV